MKKPLKERWNQCKISNENEKKKERKDAVQQFFWVLDFEL